MLVHQENLQRDIFERSQGNQYSRGRLFIYGNGGAGRWLWKTLEDIGVPVHAFVDTDIKNSPSILAFILCTFKTPNKISVFMTF